MKRIAVLTISLVLTVFVGVNAYAAGALKLKKTDTAPSATADYGTVYVKEDATAGGFDSYTKLLLHCDGANASTAFTDSATSKGVTAIGNAKVSTAQYKFGGASGLFDGSGDYLSLADSADWDFDGDFTIDFWVRFNAISSKMEIVSCGSSINYLGSGKSGWNVMWNSVTKNLQFEYQYNNSFPFSMLRPWTPIIGNWYHVAIVRSGSAVAMYVNGSQLGTTATYASTMTCTRELHIGADSCDTPSGFMNGYIDEVRISKGIARWTSNFSVPTTEYSAESNKTLNLYYKDDKGNEYKLN